jgi:hypothetical protein
MQNHGIIKFVPSESRATDYSEMNNGTGCRQRERYYSAGVARAIQTLPQSFQKRLPTDTPCLDLYGDVTS